MRKSILFLIFLVISSVSVFAQNTVKGVVTDVATKETLPGASISVAGTTQGTITGFDGAFLLSLPAGQTKLIVSFVGYTNKEFDVTVNNGDNDLGTITIEANTIGLGEVQIISSIAIDRKTPVAVANIKAEMIENKLGSQEFPEILKSTPSVYATKSGGGFGDARVTIRGFDNKNTATCINGIPVNDMEGGTVYWSNWAGLADATQSMQIQRGLGASKLAISSIGGTINIITKTTDANRGGSVSQAVGPDGFLKTALTLSSGRIGNGWSILFTGSRTTGNGYIDGTWIDAWSYFGSITKRINNKHMLVFTAVGAPQKHGQRATADLISTYNTRGHKYNSDWGYLDGDKYNMRVNFYHKPQIALNHYFTISPNTFLATSAYISFGRGGGTNGAGTISGVSFGSIRDVNGQLDMEAIRSYNSGKATLINGTLRTPVKDAAGLYPAAIVREARMNSHNWYGVLSTLNHSFSNALKLIAGVDLKYYRGLHFSKIDDLLGGAYYIDKTNYNTNFGKNGYKAVVGDKDGWDYDGIVSWAGLFTQLEYSVGKLSVFGALSASYSQYTREDRFNYFVDEATREAIASSITWPTTGTTTYIGSLPYTSKADFIAKNPVGTTSEKKVFIGYSAKGGANYNIDANHNIFANIGYFSKPPLMSNIFVRNRNEIAQDIKPEYNFAAEGGYGFRSKNFTVNLNVYYTYWMNKAFQTTLTTAGVSTTSNINGQNAIHKGIELEVFTSPMKGLTVNLMGSLGDWRWEGNATGDLYDANNVLLKSYTVFADGLKVGNAAQFTSTVGLDYRFGFGLGVNLDYNYFGENYASFFPNNRQPFVSGGVTYTDLQQPARIPAYGLFDLGLSYKVNIYKSISTVLRVSVNNLLDHSYIADATDKGVLNSTTGEFVHDVYANTGYYGFGRNWNISLKINF